jgi:hypothetical protein
MKDKEELLPEKVQPQIVRPLITPEEALKAFNEYQALKKRLRGEGDFVEFTDAKGQKKEAPTKQWRTKLTRFFGISVEIVKEEVEYLPDGSFVYKATARAIAPNGLYMEADGSCWSKTKEKVGMGKDLYHLTRSHAITRAKNRAVLELVGFGEVSAEEIEDEEPTKTNVQSPQREAQTEDPYRSKREYWDKIWSMIRDQGITTQEIMNFIGVRTLKELPREKLELVKEFLEAVAFGVIDFEKIKQENKKKLAEMSEEEINTLLQSRTNPNVQEDTEDF